MPGLKPLPSGDFVEIGISALGKMGLSELVTLMTQLGLSAAGIETASAALTKLMQHAVVELKK